MEGILTMNQKEIDRLHIIKKIESKEIKVEEGSRLIGISERQTYSVLKKIMEKVNRSFSNAALG